MSSLIDLPELVGFFSYSRRDDQHSHGALSRLRGRIHSELRLQLGRDFRLWQDTAAIPEGALWEDEIKRAVAEAVFFIPIVTPSAIGSFHCRFEFESFLRREAALGRSDLIFPILYITVPALDNESQWRQDDVLKVIGSRQYMDWRPLRHHDFSSTEIGQRIEHFCRNISNALLKSWVTPEEHRRLEEAERARQAEDEQRRVADLAEAAQRAEDEQRRAGASALARQRAAEERERQAVEARKQADHQQAFAAAKRADSVAAIDAFLATSPQSEFTDEAQALRARLVTRERAHAGAIASGDPAALRAFLKSYPTGAVSDEVRVRLRSMAPASPWRLPAIIGGGALALVVAAFFWLQARPTHIAETAPPPSQPSPALQPTPDPVRSLIPAPVEGRYPGGTVKIGVLTDMSSLYADATGLGSVAAAKMAVQDFDPAAHGLKVEVVSADHQNKPDVGSNVARQWFDVDHVDAIVDAPNSGVALAVSGVIRDRNKVFLVSGAASSDLTGPKCSPNTIHWTYDTWMLANSIGKSVVKTGGDTWFFLTADYAFGHALERDTTAVVQAAGGRVLGSVSVPLNNQDFSLFLLQAQASHAKIIGLANTGGDTGNSIKQGAEFGITAGGQHFAGLLVFITDVEALSLKVAQGLALTETFYWDMNDATRAWTKRWQVERPGKFPTMSQAGVYSAVLHYLKAVAALKSATDGRAVVAKMKEMPTEDPLFGKGVVRADGRKIHPAYLFQVKSPAESKYPGDDYILKATIPADQAFRPMKDDNCPLVTN